MRRSESTWYEDLYFYTIKKIREPSTMKITIKKYSAVATWHWDVPEDDVCGICRVQFDGTCPTCKFPGDDCSLSTIPYLIIADLTSLKLSENAAMLSTWYRVRVPTFDIADCSSTVF